MLYLLKCATLSCGVVGGTGDTIFGRRLFNLYKQQFPFYLCLCFTEFSNSISGRAVSRATAPTGKDE